MDIFHYIYWAEHICPPDANGVPQLRVSGDTNLYAPLHEIDCNPFYAR